MKALMVNGPLKGEWMDTFGRQHGDRVRYPKVTSIVNFEEPVELECDDYLIFQDFVSFFGYAVKLCFGIYGNPSDAGKEIAEALYQRDVLEHGKQRTY